MHSIETNQIRKKLIKQDLIDDSNLRYILNEIEKENSGVYYGK